MQRVDIGNPFNGNGRLLLNPELAWKAPHMQLASTARIMTSCRAEGAQAWPTVSIVNRPPSSHALEKARTMDNVMSRLLRQTMGECHCKQIIYRFERTSNR